MDKTENQAPTLSKAKALPLPKLSDLIDLTRRTGFGGAVTLHEASVVDCRQGLRLTQRSTTKAGAVRKLFDEIRDLCEHHDRQQVYFADDGTAFVVHYAQGSWSYRIWRRDGHPSSLCITGDTFDACCEAAQSHARQWGK